MKEAFEMAMIANSYVDTENTAKKQSLLQELKRVNNTLEYAL